jgi:hypothetical protein
VSRRRSWKRATRTWGRRVTKVVATVAIGAMLGFLVPTFIADYAPEPEVQARVAESPVARQFIDAYVTNDRATLDAIKAAADDKLQAARFGAEFARIDPPVHLGSWIGGGFTLHAYAAHVVRPDGTEDLLSWRIATSGGQAFLVDPPSSGQKP